MTRACSLMTASLSLWSKRFSAVVCRRVGEPDTFFAAHGFHAQAQEERHSHVVCEISYRSILFSKASAEVCLAMVFEMSGTRIVARHAGIQGA
jgi:hypothetical protein